MSRPPRARKSRGKKQKASATLSQNPEQFFIQEKNRRNEFRRLEFAQNRRVFQIPAQNLKN
jgi:hypothetical protein